MYFLIFLALSAFVSCGSQPEQENAQTLIDNFRNAPDTRKLNLVKLLWNTKNKDAIVAYFNAENDPAKTAVIASLPAPHGITQALGFYERTEAGGAFANTFASTKEFEYKGQKSPFVEFFFQAEKVSRFGLAEYKDNFEKSFKAVSSLKNGVGWRDFVPKVRSLLPPNFNAPAWDAIAPQVMSQIQAARFKVEPDLFLALIATARGSVIVENAKGNDANWGNGVDGNGLNKLGLLYMTHRQRFWYAFNKQFRKAFDLQSTKDVAFLLNWLKSYDGTTKS